MSSPTTATADGSVSGELAANGVVVFRGVPYGAPTSGVNRFRPPQPAEPWSGVRECVRYGDTAPQANTWLARGGYPGNEPVIGEDCLVLNVWTPGLDGVGRPVMVWLHGGGFEAGTASMLLYDGANVARRGDVVIVTVNHRLGVMGHLHLADHLADLPGSVADEFAGSANAGFLDIVAALRWVRTNIAAFGGDPGNVTIYGQSGGGRKVSLATATPAAAGLFHRGIVQSGSQLRLLGRQRAHELAGRLFDQLAIARHDVAALQHLPMKDVLRAARAVGRRYMPTIDGVVFDRHPWDPDAPPTAHAVPMVIGTCRTELSNQLGLLDPTTFDVTDADLAERLAAFVDRRDVAEAIALVRRSSPGAGAPEVLFTVASARGYWLDSLRQTERKAAQAAAGGAPVWSYRVMWRTPVEGGRTITPHSLDLPFVFDNVAVAEHMVGPPSAETAVMADAMCDSWLAFARRGDPNHERLPEWHAYDADRRNVMHFDVPPVAVDDPHRAERRFFDRYETEQFAGGGHWRRRDVVPTR